MPLFRRFRSSYVPRFLALGGLAASLLAPPANADAAEPDFPGVKRAEFVYETASFPECHAATIAETPQGLVAAWFGGAQEGAADVGIWVSCRTAEGWTAPAEVATGQGADAKGPAKRLPCWNPVLFQMPRGPLLLFYKVGPSPSAWWGMLTKSDDGGVTWSAPAKLPQGILGPIKNKPILVNGKLLCPTSSEHDGWRVHFEFYDPSTGEWSRTGVINEGDAPQAIQPTLLTHGDGSLQALCRDRNGDGSILSTRSSDGGKTWSPLKPLALPNPNSGIDAVTLKDGRHLLVYNPTRRSGPSPRGRAKLSVAVSADGETWTDVGVLENEPGKEFSYPAVIQLADGTVAIAYTWRRERIRVVTLDPAAMNYPGGN
ncbi:MAG TPA: sialidase family protein [Pirellulaceae bacterium]|jgi:predicted neuraminidase|nr:sialidase family protein [Pirellulaceae bacterium]